MFHRFTPHKTKPNLFSRRYRMNTTSLVGNAGGRATLTTTTKGVKIANFSLATVKRYKDSDGVQKKHTDWHRIAVFGPQVDVVANYVDKGTVICVTGALHNTAYTDKVGNPQTSSTLHADYFEIMSRGRKAADPESPAPNQKLADSKPPKVGDTCPKCKSGIFIEKKFKGDHFLACNKYPDCKNTAKIVE